MPIACTYLTRTKPSIGIELESSEAQTTTIDLALHYRLAEKEATRRLMLAAARHHATMLPAWRVMRSSVPTSVLLLVSYSSLLPAQSNPVKRMQVMQHTVTGSIPPALGRMPGNQGRLAFCAHGSGAGVRPPSVHWLPDAAQARCRDRAMAVACGDALARWAMVSFSSTAYLGNNSSSVVWPA